MILVNSTECDFCGTEFDTLYRHVVAVPRPSDRQELVATMWACPPCGEEQELPRAVTVINAIEETGRWDGREYLFVSV